MGTILFVCSGNTCRSPMAEAIMEQLLEQNTKLEGKYEVDSAGTFALSDSQASENSQRVMEKMGYDIRKHKSKQFTKELSDEADLILTMETGHIEEILALDPGAEGKVHSLLGYAQGLHGFPGEEYDIADPYRGDMEEYEYTANQIYEALIKIVERLEKEQEERGTK